MCLTFCHRGVFVHRQQFLNCSLLKVLLLLYSGTGFCLRKQSLIFGTHGHAVPGWSLPGSSSLPLWLHPDSDASAETGGTRQRGVCGDPTEAVPDLHTRMREHVSTVKLDPIASAIKCIDVL